LISLVDVELNDNGTITNNTGSVVATGSDGSGTSDFKLIRSALGATVLLDGDADFNGSVGSGDFSLLAANFGDVSGNATWSMGDFDQDGRVTSGDFSLLAANFGTSVPGAPVSAAPTPADWAALVAFGAAVPEPGTASLVAACCLIATTQRRRRRRQPRTHSS
jgi:hypothetical protein